MKVPCLPNRFRGWRTGKTSRKFGSLVFTIAGRVSQAPLSSSTSLDRLSTLLLMQSCPRKSVVLLRDQLHKPDFALQVAIADQSSVLHRLVECRTSSCAQPPAAAGRGFKLHQLNKPHNHGFWTSPASVTYRHKPARHIACGVMDSKVGIVSSGRIVWTELETTAAQMTQLP